MSRKISFSGIILAGTLLFCTDLSAQRLCRNDSTGFVRWVSGNCPSGFTNINNSVRSEYLRTNSVTTAKIQDGAVTDAKIAGVSAGKVDFTGWTAPNNSVATASIQDGAVTDEKIAAGVSASKVDFTGWTVPAGAVVSSSIATDAVTSAAIADGTITTDDVNQIDASKIVNLPVISGVLSTDSIDTANIAPGAVTGAKILDGTITDTDISPSANIDFAKINPGSVSLTSSHLASNSVGPNAIQSGAVTTLKLNNNSVNSQKIQDGTITDADISPTANIAWSKINKGLGIPGSDLADGAVGLTNIANNAVLTSKIADLAVTEPKLAGSISGDKILDNAVTSEKILNGTITDIDVSPGAAILHTKVNFSGWSAPAASITSDSAFANQAVDTIHFQATSISGAKIQDGAVSSSKIQAGSITSNVLDANSIGSSNIKAKAVTSVKIADGAVTTGKIKDNAVTSAKLAPNAFGATQLGNNIGPADLATGAVITAKIGNGEVQNSDVNIDLSGQIPFHRFTATISSLAPASGTRYFGIAGGLQTPVLIDNIAQVQVPNLFNCTTGKLRVDLSHQPGSGNAWQFELVDGTSSITGSLVSITGSSKSGESSTIFTIPANANLSIAVHSTNSPTDTQVTATFVCK
jgi:hypothetical protein